MLRRAATAVLCCAALGGPAGLAAAAPGAAAAPRAAAASAAGPCAAAGAGVQVREAGRYVVTLAVGPVPRMYTAAQARAQKPRSGVVMLEPMRDVTGGMMMAGAGRKHLRVQVCDRATGKALRAPRPTAEITSGMARFTAPLTLGYDVGTPPADVRFCQIVLLGDESVAVGVKVGGEVAAFTVTPGA